MAASSSSQSGEQQYSLRWNDFHSSILNSFRHLRDEEDFVDVTLACDNNRSFTAHKVVLSACSPYFRKLLKANPCQHPIIILRDVPASDMESLLRFMYHGEVHVSQDQLGAFLKTAQLLHVRGLADVNCGVNAKIPLPSSSAGNNDSAPATPRNTWQDNGREDAGAQSPPEKRSRSYSPALSNHVEPSSKSDLQESLLGQALEGGPTIHTVSLNNVQAQSTCDSSLSEDEDISNNESILHSVKAEPNDMMNDMEHRNTFPAALLSLQGILSGAGPSGIHSNPTDSSYGSAMPKREEAAMAAAATDTTQTVENFARLYTALRHDDARPLCRYCGRSYSSPSNLRQHVKNVHSNWPPPDTWPQCNVCGKRCKTKHYLINHQLQAHGIHQRPSMNNPTAQQQQHQSPSSSSLP
ncbi:protein abrupt isoform X7 [Ooceraea biroi]|uniref:protein abrupt isoform X7 n=1 Tax=Ooceraea biroi TaxID=2015173 RepID=UPI0009716516|nr:protein abrupt isoform X7 [Ooceraea biroi]